MHAVLFCQDHPDKSVENPFLAKNTIYTCKGNFSQAKNNSGEIIQLVFNGLFNLKEECWIQTLEQLLP